MKKSLLLVLPALLVVSCSKGEPSKFAAYKNEVTYEAFGEALSNALNGNAIYKANPANPFEVTADLSETITSEVGTVADGKRTKLQAGSMTASEELDVDLSNSILSVIQTSKEKEDNKEEKTSTYGQIAFIDEGLGYLLNPTSKTYEKMPVPAGMESMMMNTYGGQAISTLHEAVLELIEMVTENFDEESKFYIDGDVYTMVNKVTEETFSLDCVGQFVIKENSLKILGEFHQDTTDEEGYSVMNVSVDAFAEKKDITLAKPSLEGYTDRTAN